MIQLIVKGVFMRKFLVLLMVGLMVIVTGCDNNKSAVNFKNDYESINGKENKSGKIHRTVTIDENNKFEEITAKEVLEKINNNETFYVYFGSKLCPWCRSTIEMADKISRSNGVEKVYYVDIWDDEGNEILRDRYTLDDDNKLVLSIEGAKEYQSLLKAFDGVLSTYTLTDKNGNKIETGEKRIYAPNYIYVNKGKAIRLTEGISSLQKDSREELTKEMLDEEEKLFNDFFPTYCDDLC